MNRKRDLDLIVDGLAVFGLALAVAFIAVVLASGASAQQTTTVQPFGNGYIINTPGQIPSTVQPFGNGYIINPNNGQMPSTVQPFGNGLIINNPNAGIFD